MSLLQVKVPQVLIVKINSLFQNVSFMNNSYERRATVLFNLFISDENIKYVTQLIKMQNPKKSLDTNYIKYNMLSWHKSMTDSEYLTTNPIEALHSMNSEFIEFITKSTSEFTSAQDDNFDVLKAQNDEILHGDFNSLFNRNNSSISLGTPQDNISDNAIPHEVYGKIDIKNNTNIKRDASNYRNRNAIPFYQKTMNNRA